MTSAPDDLGVAMTDQLDDFGDLPDDLWADMDDVNDNEPITPVRHSQSLYDDHSIPGLPMSFFELTPPPRTLAQPDHHQHDNNGNGAQKSSSVTRSVSLPLPKYHQTQLPKADIPDDKAFYDEHFDKNAGGFYYYPQTPSLPIRTYQSTIIRSCLYQNTLVALPTGLGKTFIAAVVMHAYFRWYPTGKVIFLAPTRPLVAQQINACASIMQMTTDAVEMTGAQCAPALRAQLWREKRLFFCTPQVLQNDLLSDLCPAKSVRLLVIDEAHRALGQHAYCQVIQLILQRQNQHFRVVALTATPGSDKKASSAVMEALLIAHIEMRTEASEDVAPFIHGKQIRLIPVEPTPLMVEVRRQFLEFWRPAIGRLVNAKILYDLNPERLHLGIMMKARELVSKRTQGQGHSFRIEADLGLLMGLLHALQLLDFHGLRSFLTFLKEKKDEKKLSQSRREFLQNPAYHQFLGTLETALADTNVPSHGKFGMLQDTVLQHLNEHDQTHNDARIMVFAQYRETVFELCDMLSHHPRVRAVHFIGQSLGFTQKEQLQVLEKFRKGHYNVLVSTSIGEEGLDIADVDLILCFDAQGSSTRTLQRIGRTGRRRQGDIVFFLAKGKEQDTYLKSQTSYRQVQKWMVDQQTRLFTNNKRMVPFDVAPTMTLMAPNQRTISSTTQNDSNNNDGDNAFVPGKKGDAYLTLRETEEFRMRYAIENNEGLSGIFWRETSLSSIYRVGHARRTAHFISLCKMMSRHRERRNNELKNDIE